MIWEIEITEEFESWWNNLDEATTISIDAVVDLLEEHGPMLPRPHSDTVKGSQFKNMKELRVQHKGDPYRILYAFDPNRTAILLIGGCKTGNKRWYKTYVPIADKLYEQHLRGEANGEKVFRTAEQDDPGSES